MSQVIGFAECHLGNFPTGNLSNTYVLVSKKKSKPKKKTMPARFAFKTKDGQLINLSDVEASCLKFEHMHGIASTSSVFYRTLEMCCISARTLEETKEYMAISPLFTQLIDWLVVDVGLDTFNSWREAKEERPETLSRNRQ